jgi:hypothetical protein
MDEELEKFKTEINLTEYAASQGYSYDRKESSRSSAVMRGGDGDKVIVARGEDGHWTYFSAHDSNDNGSIIDFVINRERCSFGQVRQLLRRWLGSDPRPRPELFTPTLKPVTKDRANAILTLAKTRKLTWHRHLEEDRCIPASVLNSPRFAGKLRVDLRGNALFPHVDRDGTCGYEIKNRGYTGFSAGGEKGLWFSAVRQNDHSLVFAESGIDALSYAVMHPEARARYASIAGAMNPNQLELIRGAASHMIEGTRVVIAMDNDTAGHRLAEKLEAEIRQTGREDLEIVRHPPKGRGEDWNDVLRAMIGRLTDIQPAP